MQIYISIASSLIFKKLFECLINCQATVNYISRRDFCTTQKGLKLGLSLLSLKTWIRLKPFFVCPGMIPLSAESSGFLCKYCYLSISEISFQNHLQSRDRSKCRVLDQNKQCLLKNSYFCCNSKQVNKCYLLNIIIGKKNLTLALSSAYLEVEEGLVKK